MVDNEGRVVKTTLGGVVVSEIVSPLKEGIYEEKMRWTPTETGLAETGECYMADGAVSQYSFRYEKE